MTIRRNDTRRGRCGVQVQSNVGWIFFFPSFSFRYTCAVERFGSDRARVWWLLLNSIYSPETMSTGIFKMDCSMILLRPWSLQGVLAAIFLGLVLWTWRFTRLKHGKASVEKTQSQPADLKSPIIKALPGFNWETTEPLKFRPFVGKDKYNLTMGMISILHIPRTIYVRADKLTTI